MEWKSGIDWHEKREIEDIKYGNWHKKFIIFPRKCIDGMTRCLMFVERIGERRTACDPMTGLPGGEYWSWKYRPIQKN